MTEIMIMISATIIVAVSQCMAGGAGTDGCGVLTLRAGRSLKVALTRNRKAAHVPCWCWGLRGAGRVPGRTVAPRNALAGRAINLRRILVWTMPEQSFETHTNRWPGSYQSANSPRLHEARCPIDCYCRGWLVL